MNAATLVRSPPAVPRRAVRALPPRKERPGNRRAWAVAFVVSAVVHLLLLLIVRFDRFRPDTAAVAPTEVIAVRPAVGTRIEQIQIVPDDALVERPPEVVFSPPARTTAPPSADLPVVRDVPPAAAPGRTGASSFGELLRPGEPIPEVWRPPSPIHSPLDPRAAADARLSARLGAYNDSVALAAAEAARAVDWTRTDEDGGRWGISPQGIHLGDITIPVPINFSPGPGKRDEVAGRVRDWGEIQAQGARVEGQETFEERVKAIRERKERERRASPPPR